MKAEMILKRLTSYPYHEGIVYMEKYKEWITRRKPDSMSTYENGTYEITGIELDGCIVLTNDKGMERKILMYRTNASAFNIGDIIKCTIKKKTFFVYWEFVEVRKYQRKV